MSSVPETTTYAKQITIEEYNQQKDDYTQKALKELNEQMKTFKPSKSIINSSKKISLSLPNSDNDDNDNDNDDDNGNDIKNNGINDSDSDYEDKKDINDTINSTKTNSLNFIIKHYVNEQAPPPQQLLKKRKITNAKTVQPLQLAQPNQQSSTMTDAIYAQHELDMDVITKLKLKINTLKTENEDLDSKKHFLTLELSNAQCDVADLKKQIDILKYENSNLKRFIIIMKKNDESFELYLKTSIITVLLLMLYVIYYYM